MIRILDIFFSLLGLILLFPIFAIIFIFGLFDTGSPLFRQERIGRNEKPFILVKFRTMTRNSISVATHLADANNVTSYGHFLRKTKLDELPQLWNVLKGEMSLVGPRPGLINQFELINARRRYDVFVARPGITGMAQINGIDMSTPELLAQTDARMLASLTPISYLKYITITVLGRGQGDAIIR